MPRRRTANSKSTSATTSNRLRIIGGEWRSRILSFADADGLRPTTDRVRETLFNWLRDDIAGAHCLDLFSGSGALAFEALSRGAAKCWMIEKSAPAAALLKRNAALLEADQRAQIVQADALRWLGQQPASPFDVVFLDPPFASELLQRALDLLIDHQWLARSASVYIETQASAMAPLTPQNWLLDREKTAGRVCSRLYRIQEIESTL